MSPQPLQIPSTTALTTPLPQPLRTALYSSLLTYGSIRHIESTLTQELAETGWLDRLRAYITQQLRDGECATVDEVMAKVVARMGEAEAANGAAAVNGNANANGYAVENGEAEADLKVPEKAIREGARVVRQELERVCEIKSVEE